VGVVVIRHCDGQLQPPVAVSPPRARLVGLLICVAAVTLAGCQGGPPSSVTHATSQATSTSSTSQTASDVSAEVRAAYQGMWSDLVTAAETSDYQSALLPHHATGEALTLLVQGLARDQLHDIVTRGGTNHQPLVTSLSPTEDPTHATMSDCFDDTHWIEYTTAGKKAKNTPGGRRATTADLVKTEGRWKVSQLTIEGAGTC
jgi:hypothetical protein